MNIVFFTGNVGKDAEVRTVNGKDVANFNVAVKQGFSRDAPTEWFRVAVWGQRASFMKEHVRKGAKVAVCGDLEIGSYEGKPQYNVRAHDVDPFCGGKREGGDQPARQTGGGGPAFDSDLDDDVPFITDRGVF